MFGYLAMIGSIVLSVNTKTCAAYIEKSVNFYNENKTIFSSYWKVVLSDLYQSFKINEIITESREIITDYLSQFDYSKLLAKVLDGKIKESIIEFCKECTIDIGSSIGFKLFERVQESAKKVQDFLDLPRPSTVDQEDANDDLDYYDCENEDYGDSGYVSESDSGYDSSGDEDLAPGVQVIGNTDITGI